MYVSTEHDEGTDFGTLVIQFERDDSVALSYDGKCELRLPLYNHEARRVIEALEEVAKAASLT